MGSGVACVKKSRILSETGEKSDPNCVKQWIRKLSTKLECQQKCAEVNLRGDVVKCVYFNWLTESGVDKICELITSRPMDGSMRACIFVADDWIYWKGKRGTDTHQCHFWENDEMVDWKNEDLC